MTSPNFPKINIEHDIPIPDSRPRNNLLHHYYEQIGDMKIGDSFLVVGAWGVGDTAMSAIRMRGWGGSKRKIKKDDSGNWTFRIWRIK